MTAYVLKTSSPDVFSTADAKDVTGKKLIVGSIVAIEGGDYAKVYAIQRVKVSNGSTWIAGARSCDRAEAEAAGLNDETVSVKPIKVVK